LYNNSPANHQKPIAVRVSKLSSSISSHFVAIHTWSVRRTH